MTDLDGIGGVLSYIDEGGRGIGGQTLGANGAGEYAFVIQGTPEEAARWARDQVRHLEGAGHRLRSVAFIYAEEGYSGPMVRLINARAAALSAPPNPPSKEMT